MRQERELSMCRHVWECLCGAMWGRSYQLFFNCHPLTLFSEEEVRVHLFFITHLKIIFTILFFCYKYEVSNMSPKVEILLSSMKCYSLLIIVSYICNHKKFYEN